MNTSSSLPVACRASGRLRWDRWLVVVAFTIGTLSDAMAYRYAPIHEDRIYDQYTGPGPSLDPAYWAYVIHGSLSNRSADRLGQVFVPGHSTLDFIEVLGQPPPVGLSQTLRVDLREGISMDGPLIASSLAFQRRREEGMSSEELSQMWFMEFVFPSTVTLSPGEYYTFEIVHVAGWEHIALGGTWGNYPPPGLYGWPPWEVREKVDDLYEPGWFVGIRPERGEYGGSGDLWFRTGVIIPEPDVLALFVIGATLLLAGRRRTQRDARRTLSSGNALGSAVQTKRETSLRGG